MKTTRFFFVMALFAVILSSCMKDDGPCTQVGAKFLSTIGSTETRASNTTWTANDAIGIYALNTGTTLAAANIYDSKENIKHTTPGNGVFTVAVASEEIIFPTNGDQLDFIAYYPYKTTITNYIYPVDVAIQSNLEDIDLLYSNNAIQKDNSAAVVTLNFKHLLSKLVLNIEAGVGVTDLTGLTISVNDLNTKANFSLVDGTIPAASFSTPLPLAPAVTVASGNLTATTEAILIPAQNLNTAEIVFTLGSQIYKWTPDSKLLESTKKYTYTIQLSLTGLVAVDPSGTIEDWTEGNTGGSTVTLTPETGPAITPGTTLLDFTSDAAGSLPLTFTSTEAWTAVASEAWVTLSATAGPGDASITVDVTANPAATQRTATITITAGTATATINVKQAGTAPAVVNLALNPSFEAFNDPIPDNWTKNANMILAKETTGAQDGSNAVNISAATGTGTGNLEQIITGIVPGETYEISFWYKENSKGSTAQGIRLWSNFRTATGNIAPTAGDGLQPSETLAAAGSTWTQYTITVTAPATAEAFLFGIRATQGHEGIVDNCSFVKL